MSYDNVTVLLGVSPDGKVEFGSVLEWLLSPSDETAKGVREMLRDGYSFYAMRAAQSKGLLFRTVTVDEIESRLAPNTLATLRAERDALRAERDAARADYENCAQYRDRIIEIHQNDMDALRDRLMAEHLGNSGMEEARIWEKQCSEAEDKLHDAEDAAKERHARFAELWKEAEVLRADLAAIRARVRELEALVLKLQGHMNEGCAP